MLSCSAPQLVSHASENLCEDDAGDDDAEKVQNASRSTGSGCWPDQWPRFGPALVWTRHEPWVSGHQEKVATAC